MPGEPIRHIEFNFEGCGRVCLNFAIMTEEAFSIENVAISDEGSLPGSYKIMNYYGKSGNKFFLYQRCLLITLIIYYNYD